MTSQAQQIASHFRALPDPVAAITEAWSRLSVTERAALEYDWRFWARPKQVIDPFGPWRTYGLCTGRGFGKTRTFSEFVQGEVAAGRAMRIALIAQSEDECKAVMVDGQSGLIARSPPREAADASYGPMELRHSCTLLRLRRISGALSIT
jgi:phage terminase large subunit-like protein